VLAKVRCEGAKASIVVPFWSSQTWYPELLELADDIVYYAPEFDLFLPGDTGSSIQSGGSAVLGNSGGAHPAARTR
jgi:hypothetical protein